jgi:D-tyrosyl-tRNA(Tyr) deacylase
VRTVIQRVTEARVRVDDVIVGEIGAGLLLLVGVARGDGPDDAATLVRKVAGLRIFADDDSKMNVSVTDSGGSVLVVSQFTLQADPRKGRRPSFTDAAAPHDAAPLIDAICSGLRECGIAVATGVFGADMQVELANDGPVTIILDIVDGQVV